MRKRRGGREGVREGGREGDIPYLWIPWRSRRTFGPD